MLYIHDYNCIFPQHNFDLPSVEEINLAKNNLLKAKEPRYTDIPRGILRRMGKAVRLGVGTALPLIKKVAHLDGIIMGTANGGMEDCIKFLNQIIHYEEGRLTPTNFVQSTPNAIAAQIGLLSSNQGYNITHVHRGLAFEQALLDASMRIQQYPLHNYLVGGIDEISTYNYNIDYLNGWYKKEEIKSLEVYDFDTTGSIAGEGGAMFLVNGQSSHTSIKLAGLHQFHGEKLELLSSAFEQFMQKCNITADDIDVYISGENGDSRLMPYYELLEDAFFKKTPIARFKHLTGEYPTASSLAMGLACHTLKTQSISYHFLKDGGIAQNIKRVFIYNAYHGRQHSLILLEKKP